MVIYLTIRSSRLSEAFAMYFMIMATALVTIAVVVVMPAKVHHELHRLPHILHETSGHWLGVSLEVCARQSIDE